MNTLPGLFLKALKSSIFVVSVFLLGCAATNKSIPNLSHINPENIQFNVIRNFNRLQSFAGSARVIIEIPGQGYSGTSNVYVNFPDSVFVKTEAILGIDIGSLFLDKNNFGAYAPRENILYYGEVATLDLKDFLQVEIKADELAETMVGLAQLPDQTGMRVEYSNKNFVLTANSGENTCKYWVEPDNYNVTKYLLINQRNEIILSKEYSGFKKSRGVSLPQTIKITRPLAKERLTIYYTNQKVNQGVPARNFKIKTSNNAKRIYWGEVKSRMNRLQSDQ